MRVDILSIFVWRFSIASGGIFSESGYIEYLRLAVQYRGGRICGDNKKIYSSMSQNKITVDMRLYIVYI